TLNKPVGTGAQGDFVMWNQVYNPFGNATLSTIAAALPVVTLLVLIASNKVKAHIAAIAALIVANLVAILIFTMPAGMSLRATVIGPGSSPLAASGLSLIANTAPVAYGALGTPIAGVASVTGIDPFPLGAMVGRQLPFFSLIVPFWLIWAFAGFRGMLGVWPAILVCGVSFAVPQFLISNFINPWIVDIGASLISM